jgi:hypothetical protein
MGDIMYYFTSPLTWALKCKAPFEDIRYLLSCPGANPNFKITNPSVKAPLHTTLSPWDASAQFENIRLLIDSGAELLSSNDSHYSSNLSMALRHLSSKEHWEVMLTKYLPRALASRPYDGLTDEQAVRRRFEHNSPLIASVSDSMISDEKVGWLLDVPAFRDALYISVHERSSDSGLSVLYYARSCETLRRLIQAGAPLPLRGTVKTSLLSHWLSSFGSRELVTEFLSLVNVELDELEMPAANTSEMRTLLDRYFRAPDETDPRLRKWLPRHCSLADVARVTYMQAELRANHPDMVVAFLEERQALMDASWEPPEWTSDWTPEQVESNFKAATSQWGFSGASVPWTAVLAARELLHKIVLAESTRYRAQ